MSGRALRHLLPSQLGSVRELRAVLGDVPEVARVQDAPAGVALVHRCSGVNGTVDAWYIGAAGATEDYVCVIDEPGTLRSRNNS